MNTRTGIPDLETKDEEGKEVKDEPKKSGNIKNIILISIYR